MPVSKRHLQEGLRCARRMWWSVHHPGRQDPSPAVRRRIEVSEEVRVRARQHLGAGLVIEPELPLTARLEATSTALARGEERIYGATFASNGFVTDIDLLERKDVGHTLVEVKSSTEVKLEHLEEVALEAELVRLAGVEVRRCEVAHLSREYRQPNDGPLFARVDVTDRVLEIAPAVRERLSGLKDILALPLPEAKLGSRCVRPYPCPFYERCWPKATVEHVVTLYRADADLLADLLARGVHQLAGVPAELELHPLAKRQIEAVTSGRTFVSPDLKHVLAGVSKPIAFVDFETISPAVPVYAGCRPYDCIPVQWSCHVVDEDGRVSHREFLAEGQGDPRAAFAGTLLDACAGARAIVTYGSFERKRIDDLAVWLPELGGELASLTASMIDLLNVTRDHVYHPAFMGRFGIKSVLPVLVPGLDYQDLEVREGGTASSLLEALIVGRESLDPQRASAIRHSLLSYCERDTYAMLKLWQALEDCAAGV